MNIHGVLLMLFSSSSNAGHGRSSIAQARLPRVYQQSPEAKLTAQRTNGWTCDVADSKQCPQDSGDSAFSSLLSGPVDRQNLC